MPIAVSERSTKLPEWSTASIALVVTGRREDALAAAREAVTIVRVIEERYPPTMLESAVSSTAKV